MSQPNHQETESAITPLHLFKAVLENNNASALITYIPEHLRDPNNPALTFSAYRSLLSLFAIDTGPESASQFLLPFFFRKLPRAVKRIEYLPYSNWFGAEITRIENTIEKPYNRIAAATILCKAREIVFPFDFTARSSRDSLAVPFPTVGEPYALNYGQGGEHLSSLENQAALAALDRVYRTSGLPEWLNEQYDLGKTPQDVAREAQETAKRTRDNAMKSSKDPRFMAYNLTSIYGWMAGSNAELGAIDAWWRDAAPDRSTRGRMMPLINEAMAFRMVWASAPPSVSNEIGRLGQYDRLTPHVSTYLDWALGDLEGSPAKYTKLRRALDSRVDDFIEEQTRDEETMMWQLRDIVQLSVKAEVSKIWDNTARDKDGDLLSALDLRELVNNFDIMCTKPQNARDSLVEHMQENNMLKNTVALRDKELVALQKRVMTLESEIEARDKVIAPLNHHYQLTKHLRVGSDSSKKGVGQKTSREQQDG